MHISLFALACVLALARAATWTEPLEYDSSEELSRPSWAHRHSSLWPCDVADFPEAYLLLDKVENSLPLVKSEKLRKNIVEYVIHELKRCKSRDEMDEHCAKRYIGHAMSFIHHHKDKEI